MQVGLTEEQLLLRESAERLGRSHGTTRSPSGWMLDNSAFEDLLGAGLVGIRAGFDSDKNRANGVEAAVVAESLGRHLVNAPFIGAVVASEILALTDGGSELAASVEEGAERITPVLDKTLTRFARLGEDGVAWDAAGAQKGLVLDGDRLHLVSLPLGSSASMDLTRRVVEVQGSEPSELVGAISADSVDRAEALMLTLVVADMVGTADATRDTATQYAKQRRQFGQLIGSFQAVQHRLADDLVSVESARSILWYAAWAIDSLSPSEALLAARTAKAWASPVCVSVCESAIQVRGGIGMTWEDLSHLYLRRAHLDRQVLGDEQFQFTSIAAARLGVS